MTAMFDTLKFARTLRDRGHFTPEQAEGLADAVSEAMSGEVAGRADLKASEGVIREEIAAVRTELHDGLAAMRSDIADLRAELKGDIADLRAELKADIKDLRAEFKRDISDLRLDLKGDIASLRTDMKALEIKIEAAKSETIKWVVGIVGFQSVAIIGAAVVLSRYLAH